MNETTLRSKLHSIKSMVQDIENELDKEVKTFSLEVIQESICSRFNVELSFINSIQHKNGRLKGDLCYIMPIYCHLLFNHVTDNRNKIAEITGRAHVTSIKSFLSSAEDLIYFKNKIFLGHLENIIEQCKNSQKKN